jgi:hypothetical protein
MEGAAGRQAAGRGRGEGVSIFSAAWTRKPIIVRHGIKGGVKCPDCGSGRLQHALMANRPINAKAKNGYGDTIDYGLNMPLWRFECCECFCAFEIREPEKSRRKRYKETGK